MSSASLLGGANKGDPVAGDERAPPPTWLSRVVDVAEARAQLRFAVPMVLTSMAYYGIPLVSVMFSGHLGDVHLAGATLGNSWATVTGYAFVGWHENYPEWWSLEDPHRPSPSPRFVFDTLEQRRLYTVEDRSIALFL